MINNLWYGLQFTVSHMTLVEIVVTTVIILIFAINALIKLDKEEA